MFGALPPVPSPRPFSPRSPRTPLSENEAALAPSKAARECKPGGKDRVKFVAAAREANATAKQASVALVGMQNYVTYFEAWCGLVAFGEELFAWEPEAGGERGAGEYTPVSIEDAVASHCPAQPERLDM